MDQLLQAVSFLNDRVFWGLPMVVLMLGTGIYLTVITEGVLFRQFSTVLHYTLKTLFQKKASKPMQQGAVTPFQAVCTALAGTVGTGNIIGVALAISTGGPGAVFWMWISALIGMTVKYSEVTLAVAYRCTDTKGVIVGGPMYYISNGLKQKWLAALFSIFGAVAAFGIGAAVQSNSIATGLNTAFDIPTWAVGITVTVLTALVVIGGVKRITGLTEVLVPFMAVFYIVGALIVLVINASAVPGAFALILNDAFTGTAPAGGFLGASAMYACRIGMARGVFTHEAGMGSAPIAHASAATDHPARQGLWGAFEVFFDSIVLCTVTALVILTSGLWCEDPLMNEGAMSSAAFAKAFPGGQYIVTVGLTLFAFATTIAWYYYGEKCIEYLSGGSKHILRLYPLLYVTMIYVGCVSGMDVVWAFADLFNGLMAIPNLIALIALSPVIRRLSNDFFQDPHRLRSKGTNYFHLRSGK